MQGAGNDFVVLDATRQPLTEFTREQLRNAWATAALAWGPTKSWWSSPPVKPDVDFRYRIYNGATGEEVEHCGNGARCFVRYVHASKA